MLQERKIRARKQNAIGKVTGNPAEMRWIAMDSYAKLYSGTVCDPACVEELLHGPLKLSLAQAEEVNHSCPAALCWSCTQH